MSQHARVVKQGTRAVGLALALACAGAGAQELDPVAEGLVTEAQRGLATRSVVEAEQLPEEIAAGGANLVILDVRTEEEHAAGHLAGAARVSYADWASLSLAEETGLAHADAWLGRIGALGIDADDTVLVLDNGRMTQAARVWFILQHFGVARAAVVNGGHPSILRLVDRGEITLSTDAVVVEATAFEPGAERAGRIANIDRHELKAAIERGRVQVLDARTTEEYTGADARRNPRAGHLPDAISLPHTRLLNERGELRGAEELDSLLAEAGFVRGVPVIAHCDGGGRAALAALAAARAGYGPVLNYYLSFGDWSKDATCPVVTD